MTDYNPPWHFAFPDPHDDGDGYVGRSTGPRRTQDDVAVCQDCGKDIDREAVTLDGRQFCSRECLDGWVRR